MKRKSKKCIVCGTEFKPKYSTIEKSCSYDCEKKRQSNNENKPRKAIPKFSRKRKLAENVYRKRRRVFLENPKNQICFIEGCGKLSNTIEHRKGRVGYADEWARENDVTLLVDERFWAGCCLEHNLQLENDPELSKKYQLSKLHNGKK